MKPVNILITVAVLAIAFTIIGCGPEMSAQNAGSVRLNYQPGQQTSYAFTSLAQKKVEFMGKLVEAQGYEGGVTSNENEIAYTQIIESVDEQGNATAKITIDSVKYTLIRKNAVALEFDSTEQDHDIIGASYTVVLTPDGEVASFNADQARKTTSGRNRITNLLLNDEVIIERHSIPAISAADQEEYKVGQSWNENEVISGGLINTNIEKVYTIENIVENYIFITMKGIPAQDGGKGPSNPFGKTDIAQDYNGNMVLNSEVGIVNNYNESLELQWTVIDESTANDEAPSAVIMKSVQKKTLRKL